jgi:O-methyltransferase
VVKRFAARLGYDIVRRSEPVPASAAPEPVGATVATASPAPVQAADIDAATMETYAAVRDYTMTSLERVAALCEAVRYVTRHAIPGDLVECGVWRGGSMLAAARTLLEQGDGERILWLYDTFAGMPEPTALDVRDTDGTPAAALLASHDRTTDLWAVSPLDEVKRVMALSEYPGERIRYVPGKVEDTIPVGAPQQIAILRLDTDWYESTHHELVHLLPRVSPGGVLIIDDYGFWQGARRAVDEYLDSSGMRLLLNRIDDTGRIAVVPG